MYEAVITGLGPVAPNGVGKEAFWKALQLGKSGICAITKFDATAYPCRIAGEIPQELIEDRLKNLPDWLPDSMSCKFSVVAVYLALEDAGLSPDEIGSNNSAVYIGAATTDMEVIKRAFDSFSETGMTRPDTLITSVPHTPAAVVGHLLKTYSDVTTISTTCTAGINSIIVGAESIMRGDSKIVIAGGVDTPITPLVVASFCSAGMVPTEYNSKPEQASRPFDHKRQGGILSEGAGVIVIEEKSRALRRKAKIYAKFSGGGQSIALSPEWMKISMYNAMSAALNNANLKPTDIDYICACAPGDPIIDQIESDTIKELFGEHAYKLPISSIKSMIGNPGAAAGPLQVIAGALAIDNNFVPPTVNLERASTGCDLDYVPQVGRISRVNRVMANLRGLSGGFSSMIISDDG
jgi:3-oxoacyl-[acyl-carrier-protein] synthase II